MAHYKNFEICINSKSIFLGFAIMVSFIMLSSGMFQNADAVTFTSQWGSCCSGDGNFFVPYGIDIDSSDNLYVVDQNIKRFQKFTSSGTFLSKFGTSGTANNQFSNPTGIAIDSAGNIYVADTGNHRVQKFDSSNNYLMTIGTTGITSNADGQFSGPNRIAIDSADNVYVSDAGNYRVQKFNSAGTFLLKFGSVGSGDGQFSGMRDIAIDSLDNIYVAEGSRIQKFNSAGTFLLKYGSYGSGNGQFQLMWGIGIDANNNVYTTDRNNPRVQKFDSTGTFLLKFGSYGSGNGQFINPFDVAVDSLDNIYVVDANNARIQKFLQSTIPSVPQNLTPIPANTQVSISWTAPSSTGGAAITDYKIEYKQSSSSTWLLFNDGISTTTSATVTGLTNDILYDFRVSAINSEGTGSASTTNSTPVPSAPAAQNMKIIPGDGKVTIKWTVSSSDIVITSVTVKQNNTASPTLDAHFDTISSGVSITQNTGTTRLLDVTGLTNGQTYILKIIPSNTGGAGSATNVVMIRPFATANTSVQFIEAPSAPSSTKRTELVSMGLTSNFVMPSSSTVSTSSLNMFDSTFNQNLLFASSIDKSDTVASIQQSFAVQKYTKPADWNTNTVWSVPPVIIPITGEKGSAALFSMTSVDPQKPLFLPATGATKLANGGKIAGVQYSLASGISATNMNMTSKFLTEPPNTVPVFADAKMYMSFEIETTEGINFGLSNSFDSSPTVAFTMGQFSGSTHPTTPTNIVNSAIICPDTSVNFISGSTATSTGITVARNTAGDTATECGYNATLQHFSNYYVSVSSSAGSSDDSSDDSRGGGCNDCTPPTLGMDKTDVKRLVEGGI